MCLISLDIERWPLNEHMAANEMKRNDIENRGVLMFLLSMVHAIEQARLRHYRRTLLYGFITQRKRLLAMQRTAVRQLSSLYRRRQVNVLRRHNNSRAAAKETSFRD